MAEENATQRRETGNNNRVIVIIGGLVIVALVGVIVALALNMNRQPQIVVQEPEPEQRATLVTEENVQEMVEEMLKEPEVTVPQYYSVSMNMNWHFPDGASETTDAYVENMADNETPVYFDIIRSDTEETIYQSPVLPLGSTLEHFKLDVDLDAGVYDCVCVYHLIDENQRTLTTLNMALTVTVEG
jgi:hypothetical protein